MAEVLPAVAEMLATRDFSDDPQVRSLVEAARARFGPAVQAVVLYGSFTRGQSDTLLDLYVLLEGLDSLPAWQRTACRLLPPNVYQLVTPLARAKVAVLTFDALEHGVRKDVAPYFWARFAQPCSLVYARDDGLRARFASLVDNAAERLVAAARSASSANGAEFWVDTFALTYSAELRSERASRYLELYQANPAYFDALHAAHADRPHPAQSAWRWRIAAGKLLSVARIAKSAFTFDDPVDYALWKVARHSGVTVTATERQRRYPLIFAWPLLWRLYRQGALK
jgi:hypothetical protein